MKKSNTVKSMNTNKFFSISRFYQLLRNDILLNYKKYLYIIAGAFILGFIFLYLQMPRVEVLRKGVNIVQFDRTRYILFFYLSLWGLGAFVGSGFSELSNKVKTSNYLLMPASTFEKFLSQFFIRIVVAMAIFLFIFWVDAHLARAVSLSQTVGENHEPASANVSKNIPEFHYSMFLVKSEINGVNMKLADGIALILGIFSFGVYLFSAKLFFKKMGLVKSILSLAVILILLLGFNVLLSHIFYPETVGFNIKPISYLLQNGYTNENMLTFAWSYCASLFLIPLGYYKLKEKQL